MQSTPLLSVGCILLSQRHTVKRRLYLRLNVCKFPVKRRLYLRLNVCKFSICVQWSQRHTVKPKTHCQAKNTLSSQRHTVKLLSVDCIYAWTYANFQFASSEVKNTLSSQRHTVKPKTHCQVKNTLSSQRHTVKPKAHCQAKDTLSSQRHTVKPKTHCQAKDTLLSVDCIYAWTYANFQFASNHLRLLKITDINFNQSLHTCIIAHTAV